MDPFFRRLPPVPQLLPAIVTKVCLKLENLSHTRLHHQGGPFTVALLHFLGLQ